MKEGYTYWNYALRRLLPMMSSHAELLDRYNQDHRFYHNWQHIEDLLSQLEDKNLLDNDVLFLATIFHDAVYDPKASDNEEKSAMLFEEMYKGGDMNLKSEVIAIILDTKTHKPTSDLSKIFCEMDMDILRQPLGKLIEYENKIFKEFQCYDWKDYKVGRIKVLKALQKNSELEPLIGYVQSRTPNIGVYAGSFDPFHIGHQSVLLKAEQIFDKVIIARGRNLEKAAHKFNLPNGIMHRQIENYAGLVTDFVSSLGYDVTLIRGLRNSADLQYEMTQYRFLQDLKPDIKMVSIFCDKGLEHISSSAIRQMEKFNKHDKYLLANN